jgi:hypothetical protein
MNKTALAILAALSVPIALADDFKTIDGKDYKNVTVSRVEPDGIVLITKTGILKVYFTELPKEVQERFNYDAKKAAEFTSQTKNGIDQLLHQRADANARAAETAAELEADYEQRQGTIREQAAEEARNARRAASVKAAMEHGEIIPGMTMDECVRVAGRPRRVLRNIDAQEHSIERWQYRADWVYFEDGIVTRVQRMMRGTTLR